MLKLKKKSSHSLSQTLSKTFLKNLNSLFISTENILVNFVLNFLSYHGFLWKMILDYKIGCVTVVDQGTVYRNLLTESEILHVRYETLYPYDRT